MTTVSKLVLAASVASATTTLAQDTVTKLPPMVTVTRQPARSPFDLPLAISVVSPDSARPGQTHVVADQMFSTIPGVTVANRTNPSQDVRVSVRGFGARSAFGVRSIRVLRDGMPLTLPDGQTPLDILDLESVGRIEIIRGTASALYGNASGGVIDIRSVDPGPGLRVEGRVSVGSDALRRSTALVSGTEGPIGFQANVGQTVSNGYRAFSHQRLTNGFARASTTVRGTSLSIVGLALHMPLAENPGALTAAQLDTATMADHTSILKKARKEVDQLQIGLSASRRFSWATISASGYGGNRTLYNPQTFAIVGVDRTIAGGSVRADVNVPGINGLRVTAGGDIQRQNDARKNWGNCNGLPTSTTCPVGVEKGALSLDQGEFVTGGGPYASVELQRGMFRLDGGMRYDAVRFNVQDHFFGETPTPRDDSGARTLHAISPMVGVAVRPNRTSTVYANYSTAFETPTSTEMGNHPDGSGGLNQDLRPQYSRTFEVGAKQIVKSVALELAAFHTNVRDELIPFAVATGGGRVFYRNAGTTRRNGVETAGDWTSRVADFPFELNWSYAYSRFRFADFKPDTQQFAGRLIPGIPEHQAGISATQRGPFRTFMVAEALYKSRVWANDANSVSASAKPFSVANLRWGMELSKRSASIAAMFGVNNVFDERYVGSIAVNATTSITPAAIAAAKWFEPSAGRTIVVGATVRGVR